MGQMEDGWKRIIRKLAEKIEVENGYISLNLENSIIEDVPTDTWVSPVGGVQIGNAKNFEYDGTKIVYTGTPRVLVSIETYQAVIVSGGGTKAIQGTSGQNLVPCENFAMFGTAPNNVEAIAVNQCRFEMENGDTLDAFIKHFESGLRDLTISKGVYHVYILDVLS